jgi:hypothetical protein
MDVLSWTLTELRSPGARQRLGEFHTPPQVSQLIANITVDGLPPAGERFLEPAGGSGGLFRALAQRLRELGGDPADYEWVLIELDGLAAAAAAVNAIVWGLGSRVVVARGDALCDPQVAERAGAAGGAAARRAGLHPRPGRDDRGCPRRDRPGRAGRRGTPPVAAAPRPRRPFSPAPARSVAHG